MYQPTLSWSLISSDQALSKRGSLKERDVLQLKGIFLSLDDDKDGQLSASQLNDALKLLGFNPREKLVSKFYSHQSKQQKTAVNGGTSTMVDFNMFVSTLSREKEKLAEFEKDLDYMFEYLDPDQSGYISRLQLKHFLVEVESPLSMSNVEYNQFLKSIPVSPDATYISTQLLKSRIMFGLDTP